MASYLRAKGTQESNLSNLRRGVREKLRNGVFKLSHGRRGSRRSAVWEHFRMVEDEHGMSVGYAGCLHCFDVLRHDAHVSGTSSLFSHLRSCPGPAAHGAHLPEPADLSEVIVKEELVEDDPQHGQQQDPELLEASVDWLASELMPAQVLHGEGFIRLAQLLVDCGARQGTRDAIVLLPTQAQVEARMAIRAKEERQKLRAELGDRIEHGASLVLCESPVQQGPRVLLLRTLYDWCFQTCLLGLCPPPTHVADHDEPRAGVATILKKFEIVESWEKLPLVSGGTMQDWETHVPCASHMLCRIVTHMLQAPQPLIQQVRGYLNKFRSLVRWAAQTQNKELTDRFPTGEEDQQSWLQTLAMVEGVCNMRTEIKRAGPRPELRPALGDTTQAVMKELISVLDPVRVAVTELEAQDTATLHKVVPWLLHIRNSCAIHDEDSGTLAAMKTALQEGLDNYASPCHLHRVAVFFNPRMNSLKVFGVEEQQAVRQTVLHMTSREAPSPSKGSKKIKPEGPLAYLEDAREDALTAEKEMEVYAIMRDAANSDDLLAWWQRNAPLLPLLAAAATRVLTIPASSAVTTFDTVSDKFLHLSAPESSNADDLVFLHSRLVRN
ncbi:Transposable element Hobo transposase [Portunus trituberculatus]|uniref:Transposable element Hobo transposase n=1 Tax=Portunus trituberculatus TaxID=210409 RepID=A0A5B7D8T8_PORTR|nr:Transposable element Hobo transposase [Portunus trituberculatus]